jgi:hypothetical protein
MWQNHRHTGSGTVETLGQYGCSTQVEQFERDAEIYQLWLNRSTYYESVELVANLPERTPVSQMGERVLGWVRLWFLTIVMMT